MDITPTPTASHTLPDSSDGRLHDLIRDHRAPLLDYATRLTAGDGAWAEDVVQEAFVRAWRHIDRLTPEYGSVNGWLRRVVHNLVMDGYRAARCRPALTPLDETCVVAQADRSGDVLRRMEITDMLETLPEPHRSALVATFLKDRTAAEAALELGVPVGTVKSRVFYGLRLLRSSPLLEQLSA